MEHFQKLVYLATKTSPQSFLFRMLRLYCEQHVLQPTCIIFSCGYLMFQPRGTTLPLSKYALAFPNSILSLSILFLRPRMPPQCLPMALLSIPQSHLIYCFLCRTGPDPYIQSYSHHMTALTNILLSANLWRSLRSTFRYF